MKSSFTLKSFFLAIFSVFFFSQSLNAQCTNVVLTTQTEVNNFVCGTVSGNLTIEENTAAGDPITTLEPIFANGLRGVVGGNVFVQNCPSLTSLQGLDGITQIIGDFRITNCPELVDFGNFNFQLTSVGNFFLFTKLPKLTTIDRLVSLQSVGNALAFQFECGLTDFTPLNSLTSCPFIEFYETTQSSLNIPFTGITQLSYLNIFNNAATSIEGFTKLQSIVPNNGLSLIGQLRIVNNSNLNNFRVNSAFNSAGSVLIQGNSQLASCCFVIPLLDSNPSPLNISNNAFGCSSVSQIEEPTLSACPSDFAISTGATGCTANTSIQGPSASDLCDFAGLDLNVVFGDGSSINLTNLNNNETFNYTDLPIGPTVTTFIARDTESNTTSCSFTISVEDTQAPVISNIPADVTIFCDDPFPNIPNPLVTDNCDDAPVLTASSSLAIGPCGLGEVVETQAYTWTATDAGGNMTSENWTVTRISDFSFDLGPDVELCGGGTYIIDPLISGGTYQWSNGATSQSIAVNSSGTYSLTLTTSSGCCFVDEIDITLGDPPIATATGATLDCGAASVQITGASSIGNSSFAWVGPGGFTSNDQNPDVSSIGDFILTITTPEGCTAVDTATVLGDTNVPDATAMGGTINCAVSTVQLNASSATADVSYSWTGPDGFTSNDQNPIVNTIGLYILTVTGSNGCSITADAQVIGDTIPPILTLTDSLLTCNIPEISYKVEGNAIWSGPNGFASLQDSVGLSLPGTYSVTVTAANSCTSVASFELLQDTLRPDISAQGGVINCASGQDTLRGNSSTPGVIYNWIGPDSFSTNIQNPIAATPGIYTLTVIAPNGCSSSEDVILSANLDAPEVEVNSGTIDCINTTLDLLASSGSENLSYTWVGPNGFTASGDSIQVTVPGSYTVSAENEDGCIGIAISEVIGNIDIPQVDISADNLNCIQGASRFTTEVSEDVVSFSWTGPNDFTSTEKEPEVSVEGLYILQVTAQNGCTNLDSLNLVSDVEAPDAMAQGGMLTCTENTIEIIGSTSSENATFLWVGPEGFASNILNPVISVPGTYIFTVSNPNGCTAVDSAIVIGDPDLPIVTASGGTIDCNNFEVQLIGSSTSEGASVRWDGPNGYISFSETPIVDLPGDYTFTVTSTGNCVAFTTVNVTLDTRDPNLTVAEGFLDCENGVREFNAITNASDGVFSWTGPDGFTSDLQNPIYTKAGVYMVTVTGTNGCFTTGAIEVEQDIPYEANLIITGNDAVVEIIGGTNPFTIIFDDNIEGPSAVDLTDGDHFVRITDGLGCEEIIEFTIMSSSVEEEDYNEIKVFPNPAQDLLNIDWENAGVDVERLLILNSNGQIQTIKKVQSNNLQLNIDDLPTGIYYLKIEGQKELIFKKFLKI